MKKTVVFDFDGVIHSYTSGWKGKDVATDPPVPGIKEALKEIHDMLQYVDEVCKEKPPAIVYIDDRAICFDGRPENLLEKIQNFVPWNKRG